MDNKLVFLFICCCVILFSACSTEKRQIQARLTDVEKEQERLILTYTIENHYLLEPVWFCLKNDFKGTYPTFEAKIDRTTGHLSVKVGNVIVPRGMLLEEPVFAIFRRISSGKSLEFKLAVEFPMSDMSPFDPYNNVRQEQLPYDELTMIDIHIEHYRRWFFPKAAICCEAPKHEVYINCHWAEKHPGEFFTLSLTKDEIEAFMKQ